MTGVQTCALPICYQMGGGIVDLASFFNGTRCDTAKSPQDIQNASQQFASGLAKIGVGGFFFLLGLAGAKKGAPKSEGIEPFASQPTFRGDGRAPGVIFEDGLQPRGTSADLESYVKSNKASSFVGTSKSESVAAGFAHVQGGGYVYTVDPKGLAGIDVNKAFPGNPFPYEQEIVFPGGISSKNIVGARPVANDGTIGDFIPNPKYNPTK